MKLQDSYKLKKSTLKSVVINEMHYYKAECGMVFSSYKNANNHSIQCDKCREEHNNE